ncbi:MAG: transcription antitermination factor NusB [Lachnospiraceae bacterium]|nr:transcription antitermination factor NusB [Lachnospiraceae bacterium]
MTAHSKRVQVFKVLFETEFHEIPDMERQCELFFDTVGVSDELEEVRREIYRLEKQRGTKGVRALLDDCYDREKELIEKDKESQDETLQRVSSIMELLPEIDRVLSEKTDGWDLDRMGKVELTILRLATYEILYDDSIDTAVSINEAVEIAKEYGAEESYSFVNGVLAKIAG